MKHKVAFLLAIGLTHLYGANILLNPGFESPAVGSGGVQILGTGSGALTNWTVTGVDCGSNCVLILDTNYTEASNVGTLGFAAHGGNQSLDVTGAGNTLNGGIQQTVNLTINTNYALSFWVGNMDDRAFNYLVSSSVNVLVNGVSQGIFTNSNSTSNVTDWSQFSLNFVPTQVSNIIEFRNATASFDNLLGLDDVSLDAVDSAVPEPAAFGLVSLGLGAAAVLRRRFNN
jgi:hypothetical protein